MTTPATRLTVRADQLTTRPDLFQFREVGGAGFDEARVQRIVAEYTPSRFDPLLVVPSPDGGGQYIVLGGHHRLEAVRRLALAEVPITVLAGDIGTAEGRRRLAEEAIITNYGRAPTNIREDARAARALRENGRSPSEVGAPMGQPTGSAAPLADREELVARQERREAVARGQTELPGTPDPTPRVRPSRTRPEPVQAIAPKPKARRTTAPKKPAPTVAGGEQLYLGIKIPEGFNPSPEWYAAVAKDRARKKGNGSRSSPRRRRSAVASGGPSPFPSGGGRRLQ